MAQDLGNDVRILFSQTSPPESEDQLKDYLAHTALANTYLTLTHHDMMGSFTPHRFLPEEFRPFLEGLSVKSLSREELAVNALSRNATREELVKKARREPKWFADAVTRLFGYEMDPFKNPETGISLYDMPFEERLHAEVTASLAYKLLPDLWRDVSLKLVGKGNYLIGFKPNGQAVSKRIRESPDNPAALRDTQVRWRNLAGHALSFFDMISLDKLVQDRDIWSDASVVKGYPWVADADKYAHQLLRFGYDGRERYNPILHHFPISKDKMGKATRKHGQSIASITILDLDSEFRGLEYVVRHVDNTIAVGKVFLSTELEQFMITHSNHVQYMNENPGSVNDPILGLALLVAAMGRDMMVYDKKERDYKFKGGVQKLSTHGKPEPIEIWLPQSKYAYNIDPSQASSEYERLGQLVRGVTPHWRSRHKRKLPPGQEPSPRQLQFAGAEGYDVPIGYTFVKGHRIGDLDDNNPQQYKSKSAAAVLFGAR